MSKVSKETFKKYYRKYGRNEDGWTSGYWYSHYEDSDKDFYVEEPQSPQRNRMFIIEGSDFARITFLAEEAEERLFE